MSVLDASDPFWMETRARSAERRSRTEGPGRSICLPGEGWYSAVKAAAEFTLALVLLVLTAPVMALAMALVKLTSRGPALYSQTRLGLGSVYWNVNLTADSRRQDWANFVETGPGVRIPLPQRMYFTVNALKGRYLIDSTARRATFNDIRVGLWFSFTR